MASIVVGYTPRPEGEAALRRASMEAQQRGAKLVVVNSYRGGRDFDPPPQARGEQELAAIRQQLTNDGVEHEIRHLVHGMDPADDLIQVAKDVDADFIVIGLRRRTPVGKVILGSTAQTILLEAPFAVLAVKAEN